jgi:hypothetical protein
MPTAPVHQACAASHSVTSKASARSAGPNSPRRVPVDAPVPRASTTATT